jgi:hypothetical protein
MDLMNCRPTSRRLAVTSFFIGPSNELGEFESGVVAQLFGIVLPAVLVELFLPELRPPEIEKLNLEESRIAHEVETHV